MSVRELTITIDGPSGAGKSSVSKALAQELGLTYMDTGAMFRAVALAAERAGVEWSDEAALAELLGDTSIGFVRVDGQDHITLDGEDVESQIRSTAISQGASTVAVFPTVRQYLLELQREMGAGGGVILEGRDTGSVVFPQAEIKIFLEASVEERARRRLAQLGPHSGQDLDSLIEAMQTRDRNDTQRQNAPLVCPQGAHRIDASSLSFQEVVQRILEIVQSRA